MCDQPARCAHRHSLIYKIIDTLCIDDSPKNDRFSGFHHPVNFRSHLVSLRNRTRSDPYRRLPIGTTVNCSIFAHLRSRHQKPHSIDCKSSGPDPYRGACWEYIILLYSKPTMPPKKAPVQPKSGPKTFTGKQSAKHSVKDLRKQASAIG